MLCCSSRLMCSTVFAKVMNVLEHAGAERLYMDIWSFYGQSL